MVTHLEQRQPYVVVACHGSVRGTAGGKERAATAAKRDVARPPVLRGRWLLRAAPCKAYTRVANPVGGRSGWRPHCACPLWRERVGRVGRARVRVGVRREGVRLLQRAAPDGDGGGCVERCRARSRLEPGYEPVLRQDSQWKWLSVSVSVWGVPGAVVRVSNQPVGVVACVEADRPVPPDGLPR